ncbi:MAG: SDR family oxidoreductase [Bacteroidia bacterium]
MNIVVTGASSGIGFETVKAFCKDGNHTIVAIARNTEKLKILQKECAKINAAAKIIPVTFDLSDVTKISTLKNYFFEEIKSVDILLNNAGTLINRTFEKLIFQDVQNTYNTNVFAPMFLIQALLPMMGKERSTHVVNISSMGGFQGSAKFKGLSAYSSSKAALVNLTECLAEELRPKNIFLNCLALGAVQTEMLSKAFPEYTAPVNAVQMADYIKGFALNGNRYFNGKIIPVSISTP